MKKYLPLLLLLLVVQSAWPTTAQVAATESFCGGLITTPAGNPLGYITLHAYGTAASSYYNLRKDGAILPLAAGTYFHAKCVCDSTNSSAISGYQFANATASFTDAATTGTFTWESGTAHQGQHSVPANSFTDVCHSAIWNFGTSGSQSWPAVDSDGSNFSTGAVHVTGIMNTTAQ